MFGRSLALCNPWIRWVASRTPLDSHVWKFGEYSELPDRKMWFRWSIEGAIGSKHKVDASYLSPNVNMAARLESATKQYGVSILMSADFTALLSSAMRAKCRQIDTVLVKGSSQPMGIWTIDTDTNWIAADQADASGEWKHPEMYVHNSKTTEDHRSTLDEFENHEDIVSSYCASEEFLEKWKVCAPQASLQRIADTPLAPWCS